ncbi:MAG: class I SAM-dependent methyltransferase [Paludibacteraceae bacterium]|nr:class I SAM-dependent methyltransferase [Paludibacteraceae bacterium]
MFWDIAARLYDVFENNYNGVVNKALSEKVAELVNEHDEVLECACGTGMISKRVAPRCKKLLATDFSEGMLKQARKKCSSFDNISFSFADITALPFENERFDIVIAGNVIHLLDNPQKAINELARVCRKGGTIIIPTYVNSQNNSQPSLFIRLLEQLGANFKRQFNYASYQQFFSDMGYENAVYYLIPGKMPCAIAVISK